MTSLTASAPLSAEDQKRRSFLFLACFVALVATSCAFIIRIMMMDAWQIEFGLSQTQKGEIFGAGLWPFGLSIVLFSLFIDRIGYGKSMVFAFVCHIASVVLLIFAKDYWWLYAGSFFNGLAAGTVEAVINPVVASMYRKNKTKMLTILHAGWPGGFVLGGLALMGMASMDWQIKVGIILVPVLAYGIMLLRARFPLNERVLAGVSYKDMLKEAGALSALIVACMVVMEVVRVAKGMAHVTEFSGEKLVLYGSIAALSAAWLFYTKSLGRPMYIFLLLVMVMLAITELSTDTWIKELMGPAMGKIGLDGGWVLVYTATIMMILRFCIGPIVKVLKPLGVLLMGSLFAAAGLFALSQATGAWILLAATIYGTGQAFFWPVTLGLISERFPKGGAVSLNAIAGVGMLGAGILGAPLLGIMQDRQIESHVRQQGQAYVQLINPNEETSIYGKYHKLDGGQMTRMGHVEAIHAHVTAALKLQDLAAFDPADATLAQDETYAGLVHQAYLQILGQGDGGELDHQQMVAALQTEDFFVGPVAAATIIEQNKVVGEIVTDSKKYTLARIAILPLIMAGCYLGLILYFRSKGGYKAIELTAEGQASEHVVTPAEAVDDAEDTPSE